MKLDVVTIDANATVHTLYSHQMSVCKTCNPKNKATAS
jgi:hypothetical protein